MDPTSKKIVSLIESSDPELRRAAIRIAGEVGINSRAATRALGRCLRESREDLQILALKALGRLGAGEVAQVVVPLILKDGRLREHALSVIVTLGSRAAPQLQSLYPAADSQGKRAVIAALGEIGSKSAIEFLVDRLPEEPFNLQKHITASLCDALDRTSPPQQGTIYRSVSRLLEGRRKVSPETQISALNILGHFRGDRLVPRARRLLMKYCEGKHPPQLKRYALVSLNRLTSPDVKVTPELLRFMKKMLCDPDWQNVAQHALAGFRNLDPPGRGLPFLVELLQETPHFPVQSHVFARLEDMDRPETARILISFLADSRFAVREKAEEALRRLPSAVESLFDVLLTTDDLEVAQRVNAILRDFPLDVRRKYLDRAANALVKLFDKNDERYEAFLDFVRSVDPEPLRKRIYEKTKSLKKGRSREKWHKIAACMQLLWDNHLITPEGRYLFAVALIRLNSKDLSPDARRANLGIQVIRALIYDDSKRLTRMLKKDTDLKPEDYFYLGFHFSEESEQTRSFGLTMLEHVVKKFPRSSVTGPAKHKLEARRRMLKEAAAAKMKAKAKAEGGKTKPRPAADSSQRLTIGEGGSAAAARATRRKSAANAGSPGEKTNGTVATKKSASRSTAGASRKSSKSVPKTKKAVSTKTSSGRKSEKAGRKSSAARGKKQPASRKGTKKSAASSTSAKGKKKRPKKSAARKKSKSTRR